jgi:hypothetical protein
MKNLTWDSGYKWDDPNLRWGEPSYVLEPGDPGYVPPSPSVIKPKTKHTMSNNPIPEPEKSLLALAHDCAKGCLLHQDEIGLKQTRGADLNTLILALKGDAAATPVVLGLIYIFKQKDLALGLANAARAAKDKEANTFLTDARSSLIPILGRDPSDEWALAGFANPPANSNAVPRTQGGRIACLAALAIYLTQHPTYEVPAGGPRPEVTATRALALHTQLTTARQTANDASTAQELALNEKDGGFSALRRQLIALVDELQFLLADDDPRWEVFGLNIPASPRAPDPATNLTLTAAGTGSVLAEWDRGMRSDDDRILIKVVGVDADYTQYGKSGGDGQEVIKGQPSGATLSVKIVALNGSLEADSGPEAQISVP